MKSGGLIFQLAARSIRLNLLRSFLAALGIVIGVAILSVGLVSRTGIVLSTFDFSALSETAEGVTIASDGTIYLTDETPNIYVLTAAVPEPSTYALLFSGLAAAAFVRATRRRA